MSLNSAAVNNSNALYVDGGGFNTFHLVSLDPVAIGTIEPPILQSECAIAIGRYAGYIVQGICAIAIGHYAGEYYQADVAVAIGYDAGAIEQSECAIALGFRAGMSYQNTQAIAIGMYAGSQDQDQFAVSIGSGAGFFEQSSQAIAIGMQSGSTNQGYNTVAIGSQSGEERQGAHSIAVGAFAGNLDQHANSIILNATGTYLNSTATGACYIAPMRNVTSGNVLYYDPSSKEVSYGAVTSGSGGGIAKTFFMDFYSATYSATLSTATSYGLLSNSVNSSTQQVTTILTSSTPYTYPQPATITNPATFNFSIGPSGDFATLEAALASPSVVDGMNLLILPGNYIIPNTTGIVITKQVKIFGSGIGTTILSTTASASAPTYAIVVRADNVTLRGMTIQHLTTNNTSIEACIQVRGAGSPPVTINNFVMDSCLIEYIEFGLTLAGNDFQISNSIISYVGPSNTTRRGIGIYRSVGTCFISAITFNNNASVGNVRAIQITSSSPTNVNEICSGSLVLCNNAQSPGAVISQFFNQDNWTGTSNDFSLYVTGNVFNETSAFVVLYGIVSNFGNLLNKIVAINNTFANVPGKGMIAIDGVGSSLSFRNYNNLPVLVSGNSPTNRSWRIDYTPALNSTYNSTGYNNLVFLPVTVNQQSDCCIELYTTSETLMLGYINAGQWKSVFYASSTSSSNTTGFTYTLSANSTVFYASGFIAVPQSEVLPYVDEVTLPLITLQRTNQLLILRVYPTVDPGQTLRIYSRDGTNGYLTTPLFAAAPLRQVGIYVHPTSIAALTTVTQDITFPTPFVSNPIICCTPMGITGSTNIEYLIVSVLNPLPNKFTVQIRNLNTTTAATVIRINWFAYSEQIY